MELKDQIRTYIIKKYLDPAKAKGKQSFIVISGDIHSALGLKNKMPAVCNALRDQRMWADYGVRSIKETRLPSVAKDSSTNRFDFCL
jgi:5-methylcytosine-specific restriction enzyme B